jgi:hypothetical protein
MQTRDIFFKMVKVKVVKEVNEGIQRLALMLLPHYI